MPLPRSPSGRQRRRPHPTQTHPSGNCHLVLLGRARPWPVPFGAGQDATLAEYRQARWPHGDGCRMSIARGLARARDARGALQC
jgi:hypothetical protein